MTIIVRDDGFHGEDWNAGFAPPDEGAARGLDLAGDAAPEDLPPLDEVAAIRVTFPSFADGRGFTLARRLRRMGFAGRLRAAGHVLADQYTMARRSGFDEVEIDAAMAVRQPEADWQARANWRAGDYQSRLRG